MELNAVAETACESRRTPASQVREYGGLSGVYVAGQARGAWVIQKLVARAEPVRSHQTRIERSKILNLSLLGGFSNPNQHVVWAKAYIATTQCAYSTHINPAYTIGRVLRTTYQLVSGLNKRNAKA